MAKGFLIGFGASVWISLVAFVYSGGDGVSYFLISTGLLTIFASAMAPGFRKGARE